MKNLMIFTISSLILFSCKKQEVRPLDDKQTVTAYNHGVSSFMSDIKDGVANIEIKADNSIYLKAIVGKSGGFTTIKVMSEDNVQYYSFKYDANGIVSGMHTQNRIPIGRLFNSQRKELEIVPTGDPEPFLHCMARMTTICVTTGGLSGVACKGLAAVFAIPTSIGWSLACAFGWHL